MTLAQRLVAAWYAPRLTPLTAVLAPLAAVYAVIVALRRLSYRCGMRATQRMPVPVVVVGNLTVGGSGKTPLVAALARELAARGFRPGIVSRGHGRRRDASTADAPILVAADADPGRAGDEPVLLARTGFPVAVAVDRAAAALALLAAHPECNVIIADDGLQHLRLERDVEIVAIDAVRGFGNGWRLPAGPLREAPGRLACVDAVVVLTPREDTPIDAWPGALRATLEGGTLHRVNAPAVTASAAALRGPGVHAVAGIGNPGRFFEHLRGLGIAAVPHAFADHHAFRAADLALEGATAIVMTEKDAVKCAAFADDRCWYLPVRARMDPRLVARVEERIRGPQAA